MRCRMYLRGLVVTFAVLLLVGCEKDPAHPHEDHPQELITTVLLHVWNEPDSTHVHTFAFRDVDGPGGNSPQVDTIHFHGHDTLWRLRLEFLNEAVSPPDTITEEIRREATAHQVFYDVQPQDLFTVERLDRDANGLPLGLEARVRLHSHHEARGSLRIRLFHYEGQKTAQPGGETDVDVTFPVHILPD
ncbi:MAG: hypothetical protein NZ473_04200 [Candidatus Kapabacteria bacterium]|nr:hypothetical protein [Candidatus Kapabacteria bacterium]MDW8224986.1 hypothetical protein [Bacteroidota bacterium]